jgi:hypothetical protein
MKLSEHLIALERAFNALISSIDHLDSNPRSPYNQRRVRTDIPRNREKPTVLTIPTHLEPLTHSSSTENQLLLIKVAAFEATYHDSLTPISPDMVPLVIDTGASITVTPYLTDFIGPIKPIQAIEIKGIASGLQVRGIGTVSYSFHNDAGNLQTITLSDCLYVPQCTAHLLCPHQIGTATKCKTDGFFSHTNATTLYANGARTTIQYDTTANLPLLFIAPGISSFHRYCAHNGFITQPVTTSSIQDFNPQFRNLTIAQWRKLHLHERCAHAHWEQINCWIRSGLLPCNPSLATEPDPICATCQFGKAHKRSHKSDTGKIAKNVKAPGDGVSSDGMEAGCPERVMTTHGLPTTKKFHYCSFWVDHYSQFIYVTMHETKRAEELVRSKHEFEDFASRYNVKIKNI